MNSYYQFECTNCRHLNDINDQVCSTCGLSLPDTVNVRRARLPVEVNALEDRYNNARTYLLANNLNIEGDDCENAVKVNGKGVINTQFTFLWEWLFHNTSSYQSYRRQLITAARLKAKFENDINRSVADSILFGSENDIIYAALSIDGTGVMSYGDITVILKTYAIDKRTSALEKNSFHFINELVTSGWTLNQPIPPGYMCVWTDICKLILAKLHKNINKSVKLNELAQLVLHSTGDRATDDFVELYIYGKIIATAIEKIKIPATLVDKFSPKEKVMLKELSGKFEIEIS